MNTLNQIKSTILGLKELPDGIAEVQQQLAENAPRLNHLLYGKKRKINYEGPFFNGLELDDWLAISQLVIGWVVETLCFAKGFNYKQKIDHSIECKDLASVSIQLVVALLRNNVFNPSDKGRILALLHEPKTLYFLNSRAEDVVEDIEDKASSFFGRKRKVQEIVYDLGRFCTVLNRMKELQAMELEEMHLEPEQAEPVVEELVEELVEEVAEPNLE